MYCCSLSHIHNKECMDGSIYSSPLVSSLIMVTFLEHNTFNLSCPPMRFGSQCASVSLALILQNLQVGHQNPENNFMILHLTEAGVSARSHQSFGLVFSLAVTRQQHGRIKAAPKRLCIHRPLPGAMRQPGMSACDEGCYCLSLGQGIINFALLSRPPSVS